MLKSIENAYFQAFMKIVHTFDNKVVEYCQHAKGCLPMKMLTDVRKLFYVSKLVNLHSESIYKMLSVNDTEILNIFSKY